MSFRFHSAAVLGLTLALGAGAEELRVCADPNNLPFSNDKREGFENRIAELAARRLGMTVKYVWWSERKSFVRESLAAGACDVVPGLPAGFPGVETTAPYYRSTYVFVQKDGAEPLTSLSDPRLRSLKIGIHVVGDDFAPPARGLARRGIVNVSGYSLFGAFGEANPAAKIVDAVASGDIDVAIVWGPLGGYFASRSSTPLRVSKIPPDPMSGPAPTEYSISMGAASADWKSKLDSVLEGGRAEIQSILREFGVPQVAATEGKIACASCR